MRGPVADYLRHRKAILFESRVLRLPRKRREVCIFELVLAAGLCLDLDFLVEF